MVRTFKTWSGETFRPLEELYREMDQLVNRAFRGDTGTSQERFVSPAIDVRHTDQQFEVLVDLPGVRSDEIEVEMHDGQLKISAQRAAETAEDGGRFLRRERSRHPYRRVLPLPESIDDQQVSANYTDGVLHIVLPKKQAERTRVPVKSAE